MARLSEDEIRDRMGALSGWELAGNAIRKRYALESFTRAMAFANRVAALAEGMNHHPDILVQYDKVTLTVTSHDSDGLTSRDFRLAAAIDA